MVRQGGAAQNLVQHFLARRLRERLEGIQEFLRGSYHDSTLHRGRESRLSLKTRPASGW
jgi:hypothetical protein